MYVVPQKLFDPDADRLTVAQAAALFGRSTHWVRDRIDNGHLIAASRHPITTVTMESVMQTLQAVARRAPKLRLVVDNSDRQPNSSI